MCIKHILDKKNTMFKIKIKRKQQLHLYQIKVLGTF